MYAAHEILSLHLFCALVLHFSIAANLALTTVL